MAWNDERVELLKRLWAEGLSASQIASRLGGVTRNAVIGKVHRLGLSGRATSSRSSPRPRRVQAPRQHRTPSLMFGTRGNVALKPVYEEEIEPAPAPIEVVASESGSRFVPLGIGKSIVETLLTEKLFVVGQPSRSATAAVPAGFKGTVRDLGGEDRDAAALRR